MPRAAAHASQTVPTGLPGTAPPGPAIPVTATAIETLARRRAPCAMARATTSLTAPCLCSIASGTPRVRALAALLYVTKPSSTHCELPATSVSALAIHPPVQDSAVAIRR